MLNQQSCGRRLAPTQYGNEATPAVECSVRFGGQDLHADVICASVEVGIHPGLDVLFGAPDHDGVDRLVGRDAVSSLVLVLSPHVVELDVREKYTVWVRFDDGAAGEVDLSDSASTGGIFSAWSDEGLWRSAHIVPDTGAVAWGDSTEVDICPISLYLEVTAKTFDDLANEAAALTVD